MRKDVNQSVIQDLFSAFELPLSEPATPIDSVETAEFADVKADISPVSLDATKGVRRVLKDGTTAKDKVKKIVVVESKILAVNFSSLIVREDDLVVGFFRNKSIKAIIESKIDSNQVAVFTESFPIKVTKEGKFFRVVSYCPFVEVLRMVGYEYDIYVEVIKAAHAERLRMAEKTPFFHLIKSASFQKKKAKEAFHKNNWEKFFNRDYSSKVASEMLGYSWSTFWGKSK